jgi:prephenate dehydrogenase
MTKATAIDDFFTKHTTIALIGYGRFGAFLAQLLLKHTPCNIVVITRQKPPQLQNSRLTFGTWKNLATADVIIPTVAMSAFEEVIKKIAPLAKPGAIVIDVCSVKCWPVEVMLNHLPTTVSILATHPMFGPDSHAKNHGLLNLPIMLHPVRIADDMYQALKQWCLSLGLNVIELTPTEHDQYAAFTQAYSFLIGTITKRMQLQKTPIDTWWHTLLMEQSTAITSDSAQLFLDIQTKNPYATLMRQRFADVTKQLLTEIDQNLVTKPTT